MAVRLLKQTWTVWKRRLQDQRTLEGKVPPCCIVRREHGKLTHIPDTALAFSVRSSSALASSSVQKWRQVYHTHRNAQTFAVHYHSAHLSFKMLLLWRLQLRKKLKLAKQAKLAEKFFVMRGAWRTWLAKVAEKKRGRKVKDFERRVAKRYFEGTFQSFHRTEAQPTESLYRVEVGCTSSERVEPRRADYTTEGHITHTLEYSDTLDNKSC